MKWNRPMVALAAVGGVTGLQLILAGALLLTGKTVPSELWDLLRTTVTLLVGVAAAQYLNGKVVQA